MALQGGNTAKSPTNIETEEVDENDGITPPPTPLKKQASSKVDSGRPPMGAGDLTMVSIEDSASGGAAAAKAGKRPSVWGLSLMHWGYLSIGLIFSALLGVVFPLWGYFLANIFDVFYYVDPEKMKEEGSFWAGKQQHEQCAPL